VNKIINVIKMNKVNTKKEQKKILSKKELRILLIQKDLTLQEIAARIGKSKAAITMTLQGKLRNIETRRRIAAELGVSVSDLFAA